MRLFTALLLGCLLAVPAFAAEYSSIAIPESPPAPASPDVSCTSSQGATSCSSALGISGPDAVQGPCITGNPGDPADLIGFAFKLESCADGFVTETRVYFGGSTALPGDPWQLYMWRDMAGIPYDACGMECAVANNPLILGATVPDWQSYDWSGQSCPCLTFMGEPLYVGTVYVNILATPDWYIGRAGVLGNIGTGFGNLSGTHGDWADLNNYGYGDLWCVEYDVADECGGVPVEPSTWGAMKNLYR